MTTVPAASDVRRFVAAARRATLATMRSDGRPRLVPLCFVLDEGAADGPDRGADEGGGDEDGPEGGLVLYSPIDEKPKRSADPMRLARVRDLLERPTAGVLVDQWDEDWARLAWVRLDCRADVLAAPDADAGRRDRVTTEERSGAIVALRAKYPQYVDQRLEERPLVRLTCRVAATWGDLAGGRRGPAVEGDADVEAM